MELTLKEIYKIRDKRNKDREQQYAILNWERPSLDTEKKIYDKLKTLQKSQWLYRWVYKSFLEIQKKYEK